MALALWALSLLGSTCLGAANIFGEFLARGQGVWGGEGVPRPAAGRRALPQGLPASVASFNPCHAPRSVVCSFLHRRRDRGS